MGWRREQYRQQRPDVVLCLPLVWTLWDEEENNTDNKDLMLSCVFHWFGPCGSWNPWRCWTSMMTAIIMMLRIAKKQEKKWTCQWQWTHSSNIALFLPLVLDPWEPKAQDTLDFYNDFNDDDAERYNGAGEHKDEKDNYRQWRPNLVLFLPVVWILCQQEAS